MEMKTSKILFTRQKHQADRAGFHYDIRLVHGDVAYSWATKKDIPDVGGSIILHEQPIHTASYALSEKVVIPKGNYGAGVTELDFVRKADLTHNKEEGHFILSTGQGERYLLKHIPAYGPKQWLFRNLGPEREKVAESEGIQEDIYPPLPEMYTRLTPKENPPKERFPVFRLLKKVAELNKDLLSKFQPDVTPKQMGELGVLVGKYTKGDPKEGNFFKTDASMKEWPSDWYDKSAPLGWYQWYQGFAKGKRTEDDERQIKRWISFKARHLAQLQKADPTLADLSIQPRRRQALLNWGIAPGVDLEKVANVLDSIQKRFDKLVPRDNALVNHIRKNEDTYLFHGTRHLDEVKSKGLIREDAFEHASEKSIHDRKGESHESYGFSATSKQRYAGLYTKEDLPLLIKVNPNSVDYDSQAALGRNFLGTNEVRVKANIPLSDIIFPDDPLYNLTIENHPYLEKKAVVVEMFQHDETGRKMWAPEGKAPSERWSSTGKTKSVISGDGPKFRKDGSIFTNRNGLLPRKPLGYYKEYTLKASSSGNRGPVRMVCGGSGGMPEVCYYTNDHYRTFTPVDMGNYVQRYLQKSAAAVISTAPKDKSKEPVLRAHTRRALNKLDRTGGLLVDHSMGSGKTLLYLKAIERYQKQNPGKDSLFLAPASLTTNVDKEIAKHGVKIDVSKLDVMSYEKASNAAEKLRKNKYGMVIADEAHKLRNTGTKRHQELSEIISSADRRLLGTGTTAYNHVSDIAPLVNLAAGNSVLPEGKKAFEEKYVSKKTEQPPMLKRILGSPAKEVHNLKNKRQLAEILREHVDHYDLKDDPSAKDKFPTRTDKVIEVEMSPQQKALYGYMEDKLPFHLKLKVRMNMALDKRDTAQLQAFSSGIRQVSNSLKPFMPKHEDSTPKMIAAAESMHASLKANKKFRGIAYSNYLGAGLQEYSDELTRRKVKHGMYHGGLSKTQKDQLVEDYNSGKVPVLVISSSGAEGLNLKGTRKAQILEPHFNKSKIDQVAARAVRFESHEHLPKSERTVEVEHYLSTLPKKRFQFGPKQHSIDQYLHHNSETKSRLGEQMKDLVKQASDYPSEAIMDIMRELKVPKLVKLSRSLFDTVDYTFPRAKYKESEVFDHIKDPVGSLKRDGAAFFMEIGPDGTPKYYSRRESVRGGFPDRSDKLPHLTGNKLLDHIGNVYHVELYHTGHDASEMAKDSHPAVSGILNSLPAKAIETQERTGPVRAMLLDVIAPKIGTYGEKLEHMKQVAMSFGKEDVLRAPDTKIGKAEIEQLIKDTKARADEGIIITSLTAPEDKNTRVKIKHVDTYNLRVSDITQEVDILGNPKESMGALVVVDKSGRIVCNVGTGFTREQRIEIWKNKEHWIGKLIQVKAMPSAAHKLRAPVYNGLADGEIDNVATWLK